MSPTFPVADGCSCRRTQTSTFCRLQGYLLGISRRHKHPSATGTLGLALLLAACSAPKPQAQTPKPQPHQELTLNTGPGNAEVYGPTHDLRWTVRWSSSVVNGLEQNAGTPQLTTGSMKDVAGTIYGQDGKPSATFKAESGQGDKGNDVLRLRGAVVVTSLKRQESLTGDALAYDAKARLLDATGNVRFKGGVGTMGTFSELEGTPDLTRVGTPDLFTHP